MVSDPYVSNQDGACSNSFKLFTAAFFIQYLINSVMNGQTSLRLDFYVSHCHHNLLLSDG
eukprot:scaffold48013_cov78-Cyclotella_meneghiniana.AAC.3